MFNKNVAADTRYFIQDTLSTKNTVNIAIVNKSKKIECKIPKNVSLNPNGFEPSLPVHSGRDKETQ